MEPGAANDPAEATLTAAAAAAPQAAVVAEVRRRYWAFVSYRHADQVLARRIHRWLDAYSLPKELVGRRTRLCAAVPDRLYPVFLDHEEMAGARDLSLALKEALAASHGLVVVCSRDTPASEWIDLEVRYFQSLGRQEWIVPVVIDGQPWAADPQQECLPDTLRTDGARTPVCPDIRDPADGFELAMLKTVAGILDLPLAELTQRDAQRRSRRNRIILGLTVGVAVLLGALSLWALQERDAARVAELEAVRQRTVAEGEKARADTQALEAAAAASEARRQEVRANASAASAVAAQQRAEAEAAAARSGRLAAQSQLPHVVGPRQMELAIAGLGAARTVEARQALLQAVSEHAPGKRYLSRMPELLDADLWRVGRTEWAYVRPARPPSRRGEPAAERAAPYLQRLFAASPAQVGERRELDPALRELDGLAVSPVDEALALVAIDDRSGPGTCRVRSTNLLGGGSMREQVVEDCQANRISRSRNGRYALLPTVASAAPATPAASAAPSPELRVHDALQGSLQRHPPPRHPDSGATVHIRPFSLPSLSNDGAHLLFLEGDRGEPWVADLAAGRARPVRGLDEDDQRALRFTRIPGGPGIWWGHDRGGSGSLSRIVAIRIDDGVARTLCRLDYLTLTRPALNQPPFDALKVLAAPDQLWSAQGDAVVALGFERGVPALHWCHPASGEQGVLRLPGLPTALRFSPDGRLLAMAVDERVEVLDLVDAELRLSDVAAFGSPVERLWFDAPARRLLAQAVDGRLVQWQLPERAGAATPRSDIWTLGIHNLEHMERAFGSSSRLALSADGSTVLAWGDKDRAALVDLNGHRLPRHLRLAGGTIDWRFRRVSDASIQACMEHDDCARLRADGTVARQARRDDGVIEFPAQGGRTWQLHLTKAELHHGAGAITRLLGRPADGDVLVAGVGLIEHRAGAGAAAGLAGLLMAPERVKELKGGRLPPGLVPSRVGLNASINDQRIFDSQVPVRPVRDGDARADAGLQFVAVGPHGNVVRRIDGVFGLAWAAALDADRVLLQTGQDELSSCPLSRPGPCERLALGLDEPLQALAVTPDGRLIATASASGVTVRTAAGELLTRRPLSVTPRRDSSDPRRSESDGHAVAVALSRDGRRLVALSARGDLRLWPLDPDEQVRNLRAQLGAGTGRRH